MIISRDPEFVNIVNVVPLEGGFAMIRTNPSNKKTLQLLTLQRMFSLIFESENEAYSWNTIFNLVLSK